MSNQRLSNDFAIRLLRIVQAGQDSVSQQLTELVVEELQKRIDEQPDAEITADGKPTQEQL